MKFIHIILKYFSITVLTLFLCEWVIQWLFNKKHEQWAEQTKPVYSWSTYSSNGVRLGEKRGILKLVLRPYITYGTMPNQRTKYFNINSKGYRGSEVGTKDQNRKRIVLLGGSAAFGSGADSDNDTFAAMIAQSGYEVINAAVIGHQSGQELSYLVHELINLEPDILITFDGWNDFMQSKWKRDLSQVGDVGFAQVEGQLEDYSNLMQDSQFNRISKSFPLILFPALWRGLSIGVKNIAQTEEDLPTGSEEIISSFVRDHVLMRDIIISKKGRMLVALQPDSFSLDIKRGDPPKHLNSKIVGERYLSFTEQITTQLTINGVDTINFNDIKSPLSKEHFFDQVHLNHVGNKIVAEYLERHISSRN